MFREMRRKKQLLSPQENIDVLVKGTSGVLAVLGDGGYPYAVPLSYVFSDAKIYFHCANSGHKIDAIAQCNRASFCVVGQDAIVPQEFTTYFRSVIVFGKIRILENEAEKRAALEKLGAKYSPGHEQRGLQEIDRLFKQTCAMELCIEHMTGKESIELGRIKHAD